MPFVTEELWQRLGAPGKSIAVAPYPQFDPAAYNPEAEARFSMVYGSEEESTDSSVTTLIAGIRSRRADAGVDAKQILNVRIMADPNAEAVIREHLTAVQQLTGTNVSLNSGDPSKLHDEPGDQRGLAGQAKWVYLGPDPKNHEGPVIPLFRATLDIPLNRARLEKENEQLEKVIANSKRQLDNPDIVAKMPEKVVATLRSKLAGYEAQLANNRAALGE
jgi:valyl-tRNA synthetase